MKYFSRFRLSIAVVITSYVASGLLDSAQIQARLRGQVFYSVQSGTYSNLGNKVKKMYAERISVPGVPWLRLRFGDYNFGRSSYILITSEFDNGMQHIDTNSMQNWHQLSAFFNGDAVDVELYVAPGDKDIYLHIEELSVDDRLSRQDKKQKYTGILSLCNGDSRIASTDPRVGRITTDPWDDLHGTAFLVSNGALITAGHVASCAASSYPCEGFLNSTIQFNVPPSLPSGELQHADPSDQYPIDQTHIVMQFSGFAEDLSKIGQDWAIFECLPNSNTGLLPFQAQNAFFRMTLEHPSSQEDVRITGYGYDSNNVDSYTQQTDVGPFHSESSSDVRVWHRYAVDTEGGSSGSPIIWETNGFTIGIHTNGGCNQPEWGTNFGTSFEHDNLEHALQIFQGINCVYVDQVSMSSSEDGTLFAPFNTVAEAVDAAGWGDRINIVKGSYNETLTIDKAVTLSAPVGGVIIGE